MDSWPGCSEERDASSQKEKRKGKAQDKRIEPWRYPVLDHGSIGAATLKRKNTRYEWSFAADNVSEVKLLASEGPVEVFPPTRPKPSRVSKVTSLQRAEQGAQFIRTYYPDVDIPAELIRAEIEEDERATRAWKSSDIFSGNLVDVCTIQLARKTMSFLAFPMGETNTQLNISPLVTRSKSKLDLQPKATPVYTFETPIRQIVTSSPTVEHGRAKRKKALISNATRDSFLGVRTMGSVTLFQLKASTFRNDTAETIPILTAQRSDLGDRQPADMSFLSSSSGPIGYIVNDIGDIYRSSVLEGKTLIERVHAREQSEQVLCRIAACPSRDRVVASFDTSASLLDFRVGKEKVYDLYTVSRPGTRLTFIDAPDDTRTVRLTSTDEILWLDDRNTRRPLLAVKHGREFDITLAARTYVLTKTPLTFLTSRRNSLVTVYDVSRTDQLVQSRSAPCMLPPILNADGAHGGYAFQPPTLSGSTHLSAFQLSERGSVSALHLDHLPVDVIPDDTPEPPRSVMWPADVEKLAQDADMMQANQGVLAGRAHSITDLQPAYQKLFVERKKESISAQSNAVFDTLERMPAFWQDTDVPVEHLLTTFDIALRSGAEPADASRNDWFTGSALDSAAGYRAWGQGRIPRKELARRSPWHLDVSPSIRRHVPEFAQDPEKTLENFVRYNLADGPDRTADSYRREAEARSQLALDLTLAADVFASQYPGQGAMTSFDEDMLNISLSTQAMSLRGDLEPAPVQFGFLRPTRSKDPSPRRDGTESDTNAETEDASKSSTPLGVRLLLQEWNIGTDPNNYTYHDPYGDTAEVGAPAAPRPTKQHARLESLQNAVPTPAPTQRPPTIATTAPRAPPVVVASQPLAPRKPLAAARTQDTIPAQSQRLMNGTSQPTDTWAAPPSSQEPLAATQVLPGPHGGRPSAAKKKSAKKRIGGF
ncbi:hypothetical protein L226DRAFT_197300 [Lentinus tigrinus ALCF2SS1-7]|uniref:RRN6 K-rich C-terminal domain-containing protein n=1 Tax=Lentinus tigrinus ALCF2SS1-6 TaxID=1328759 RepID=A0A5C2SR84_9APHY|nr:hypothetical protein L227DRAFT_570262 [Lentinus tigrinus ALCF2SS1-6]RPD80306.1 hypothetical protein L226DRAFT_197300 [Lentinus tigrinus ALCF2SS1-7]